MQPTAPEENVKPRKRQQNVKRKISKVGDHKDRLVRGAAAQRAPRSAATTRKGTFQTIPAERRREGRQHTRDGHVRPLETGQLDDTKYGKKKKEQGTERREGRHGTPWQIRTANIRKPTKNPMQKKKIWGTDTKHRTQMGKSVRDHNTESR